MFLVIPIFLLLLALAFKFETLSPKAIGISAAVVALSGVAVGIMQFPVEVWFGVVLAIDLVIVILVARQKLSRRAH